MIVWIAIAAVLGGGAGVAGYHYRERLRLAAHVLIGRVHVEQGRPLCVRSHLKGDEVAISKADLQKLIDANTQLIGARCFIAGAGKQEAMSVFAETIKEIFEPGSVVPKISEDKSE